MKEDLLKKYMDALVKYELDRHGIDPREELEGTALRITKDEGYKYRDVENWNVSIAQAGSCVDKFLKAAAGTNLIDHHNVSLIKKALRENGSEDLEAALVYLFREDDDYCAFKNIVNIVGAKFDVLGFCFFLKNPKRYMPIRSRNFDKRFSLLGVDSRLARHCDWLKYQDYNRWIEEVHTFLRENLNPAATMIDAHSFLWILPSLQSYLE